MSRGDTPARLRVALSALRHELRLIGRDRRLVVLSSSS
jgi:hypothetical protein